MWCVRNSKAHEGEEIEPNKMKESACVILEEFLEQMQIRKRILLRLMFHLRYFGLLRQANLDGGDIKYKYCRRNWFFHEVPQRVSSDGGK
jgi:hypothetical protein